MSNVFDQQDNGNPRGPDLEAGRGDDDTTATQDEPVMVCAEEGKQSMTEQNSKEEPTEAGDSPSSSSEKSLLTTLCSGSTTERHWLTPTTLQRVQISSSCQFGAPAKLPLRRDERYVAPGAISVPGATTIGNANNSHCLFSPSQSSAIGTEGEGDLPIQAVLVVDNSFSGAIAYSDTSTDDGDEDDEDSQYHCTQVYTAQPVKELDTAGTTCWCWWYRPLSLVLLTLIAAALITVIAVQPFRQRQRFRHGRKRTRYYHHTVVWATAAATNNSSCDGPSSRNTSSDTEFHVQLTCTQPNATLSLFYYDYEVPKDLTVQAEQGITTSSYSEDDYTIDNSNINSTWTFRTKHNTVGYAIFTCVSACEAEADTPLATAQVVATELTRSSTSMVDHAADNDDACSGDPSSVASTTAAAVALYRLCSSSDNVPSDFYTTCVDVDNSVLQHRDEEVWGDDSPTSRATDVANACLGSFSTTTSLVADCIDNNSTSGANGTIPNTHLAHQLCPPSSNQEEVHLPQQQPLAMATNRDYSCKPNRKLYPSAYTLAMLPDFLLARQTALWELMELTLSSLLGEGPQQ